MFVYTTKVHKTKLAAGVTLLLALVVGVVIFWTARSGPEPEQTPDADTNDSRITFLAQFGWNVNAEPVQAQSVTVPSTEDSEVYSRYNELQRSQGYDLTPYAGKQVMRYLYEILNYPDATEPVYATLLVYDGKIIGGDVTNTAPEGKMHGFALPK